MPVTIVELAIDDVGYLAAAIRDITTIEAAVGIVIAVDLLTRIGKAAIDVFHDKLRALESRKVLFQAYPNRRAAASQSWSPTLRPLFTCRRYFDLPG
jgi:hypothetical protein